MLSFTFTDIPAPSCRSDRRAIFLDKDGTLIENVPYNVNLDLIHFCSGAIPALQQLSAADYKLFVITNQSGVARGYFLETDLHPVEHHLQTQLAAAGVTLSGFYYCPHHPDGVSAPYATACNCRKPQPGLLHRAAAEHGIDLKQSWMIGDILHDVAAGRSAGCRTILIDNGNETEWQLSHQRLPHHLANDLSIAAQIILALDSVARPTPEN
jgi:D,D-heptose 1,7-bisphosphate phosphatase